MPPPLILKKPDLVIEDIWVSVGKIWYRIKNNGSLASNPSTSQLYIDGLPKQSDAVPSLAAGASSNESFPAQWICVLDSTHTLEVRADTGNTNSEWSEGNNVRVETYICGH
jgi:subtilase family serine protease